VFVVWFLFGFCLVLLFWSIVLRCQFFDERNPALCLSAHFIRAKGIKVTRSHSNGAAEPQSLTEMRFPLGRRVPLADGDVHHSKFGRPMSALGQ
jgi:hypothetical protein